MVCFIVIATMVIAIGITLCVEYADMRMTERANEELISQNRKVRCRGLNPNKWGTYEVEKRDS